MCECGHGKSKHHFGVWCGLDCYYCEVCSCPEYNEVSEIDTDEEIIDDDELYWLAERSQLRFGLYRFIVWTNSLVYSSELPI